MADPKEVFIENETRGILENFRILQIRSMLHIIHLSTEQKKFIRDEALKLYSLMGGEDDDSSSQ